MKKTDTIIAQATPSGYGGISIIRISGSNVQKISKIILKKNIKPRYANYLPFYDTNGKIMDKGIAIYYSKPNSFTGEDILELQGHGGPLVTNMILNQILLIKGVRIANPGEFSERAFLNKKIDLNQAESLVTLIYANNEKAVRSSINSLQGHFSKKILNLLELIKNLYIQLEAEINFQDHEIKILKRKKKIEKINKIYNLLKNLSKETYEGKSLNEGIKIVIIGRPNSGKSSLLNALSGYDRAIVTNIPGTTRDIINEYININGNLFNFVDTAGIRNNRTNDKIEEIGIKKTLKEIKTANHILIVIDSSKEESNQKIFLELAKKIPKKIPITIIRNKSDLTSENITIKNTKKYPTISISALYNKGIDLLKKHLIDQLKLNQSEEGVLLARSRHIELINLAKKNIKNAKKEISKNNYLIEIFSEEIKLAQKKIEKISKEFSSKKLLNEIFSKFCIGK